jgi:hypothetical protein
MAYLLLGLRLLAAAVLYAFLIAVFGMLRRDLRAASTPGTAPQRSARLVAVDSQDPAIEIGTVFPLRPVTSIGRGPTNTISIHDDYASTRHALVSLRRGQWWLEDLASRNGTYLNGTAVAKPIVLAGGDVIAIGRTELRLECEDGPRAEG